jgi:hypothetical protein
MHPLSRMDRAEYTGTERTARYTGSDMGKIDSTISLE